VPAVIGGESEENMIVKDMMTRGTISVRAEQSLADAAGLMWQYDCGALPVVQGDDSRLVGMITDRDICMATWSRGLAPASIFVSDAMSQNIVHCSEGDSIGRAEAIMQSNQVRRLPVLDSENRLVGILSLADIARATEGDKPSLFTSGDGVGKTLAGICKAHLTTERLRTESLA
jgi:CBS domain-containing protein